MVKKFLLAGIVLMLGLLPGTAVTLDMRQQRELFLETEALLERKQLQHAESNMSQLRDYPLYAHLQYRVLQDKLGRQSDIEAFLSAYGDTYYADDLRRRWLQYLAENRQWKVFLRHYRESGDTALQCLQRQAQYAAGATDQALNAARELWAVGRSQPQQCDALFEILLHSPDMTEALKWKRFELALQADNTALAHYVKRLMSASQQPVAEFWLRVHRRPQLIADPTAWTQSYAERGTIFAHGVERMAAKDLETALAVWDQRQANIAIEREQADRVEKKFGMLLARRKDARAYERFSRIVSASDAAVREWAVRAALLEQNWKHVDAALQRLSPEEQRTPRWQYWQGRMLQETGRSQQAAQVFAQLAGDRSFYGFLAADYSKQAYGLGDRPTPVSAEDIDALHARRPFRMVEELRRLGRVKEALRQWWFAVGQLDQSQKLLAAKLAQQWAWHPIAVFTLARADYWDDIGLRFPAPYSEQIQHYAQRQGLEPAIVYGLVRQESVFDASARSSAGALGLMQIMPGTAQYIAGKLHDGRRPANSLFEPEINLKYGTFYYKQLLDRFHGHVALAAAGYNAGPQRVVRWRAGSAAVPADIWIETIPFKETRKYVSSVLMYSIIYQQRLGLGEFKLQDLMRDVEPA
ncbi:MAG: transglycosylase SLT domain-containing protein [Gammaproteobacteria bacterium]